METPLTPYLPIAVVLALAGGMAAVIPVLAGILGPKSLTTTKSEAFEGGNAPMGSARQRFAVKFYVVALLFIVFDIEAVFLYPWAVVLAPDPVTNAPGLGWPGLVTMGIFVATLIAGLVYVWKKGVLDWSK